MPLCLASTARLLIDQAPGNRPAGAISTTLSCLVPGAAVRAWPGDPGWLTRPPGHRGSGEQLRVEVLTHVRGHHVMVTGVGRRREEVVEVVEG
jgi:hypothetical protein